MRPSRLRTIAVLAVLVSASAVGVAFVWVGTPNYGVFISTEGTPMVGADFNVLVTVRDPSTRDHPRQLAFLSLDDVSGFEIVSGETVDDPWGLANIWNLSGLDLSDGRSFILRTIPSWGAEMRLHAMVWSSGGNLSKVLFLGPGVVDPSSVFPYSSEYRTVTIAWPLQLSVAAEGSFAVGGELLLTTTVKGCLSGPRAPSSLYLSLELKPVYYRVVSGASGDDPWGLPNVWNLTGLDLSNGIRFSLTATPTMDGARVPLEARVWSPRAGWAAVQFNQTGELQNPDSVFFWAVTTVDFPIT